MGCTRPTRARFCSTIRCRTFKAVIPGGSSVPILTREEAEQAIMDYEGMVAAGTMLGSGGVIVFDDGSTYGLDADYLIGREH